MIRSNMHTHTLFSDGKHTAEENIQSALAKGFTALGFSDHVYSRAGEVYCMRPDTEPDYQREITRLKQACKGQIDILLGIESEPFTPIDPEQYDYIIGSVHHLLVDGVYYPIDHSLSQQQECIMQGYGGKPLEMFKAYFEVMAESILRNKPDIIGHFDVITKFGLVDEENDQYRDAALEAIDVAIDSGGVIEINTGAMSKGLREKPYPSSFLLKRILEKSGRVMLNSDSHFAENLDYAFKEVSTWLKEMGWTEVYELTVAGFKSTKL